MEKIILKNGVTLLYEYRVGEVTSFCIGFDAGALREDGFTKGCAHGVEHMLFKGIDGCNEDEINKKLDELFGFNNAMTNYPYVVYYGTCLSEDINESFNLYSNILLKPTFPKEGFNEEKEIIIQECREWKEDLEQHIEDELLFNAFNTRRIKETIIGEEKSLNKLEIDELKKFYKKFYVPGNAVISFVTSLNKEEIVNLVNSSWGDLNDETKISKLDFHDNINWGTYEKKVEGFNGVKLLYGFDISSLDERELEALYIFNMFLGDGVSSLLFSKVRTEKGLAYEINSNIKYEKGISLFTIYGSTSQDKIDNMKETIEEILMNIKDYIENNLQNLKVYKKRLLMKRGVLEESSIRRALVISTNEIMFKKQIHEKEIIMSITKEEIKDIAYKIFENKVIQILK
ncbi:M16 family metallopeptidase [Clostridium frigidicarnis]|uniref:Predicted Zn-dependent peptidase n=1 Tax=Clostridium frigidicarnis TaxID=84698 RepID=A0A1I0ZC03_9CLOT|nr:pitrilysin family protein [Clostridium frigidicarnis]SFB23051.1 Predicted Zn-dependent peptidase [Clostridium frigidicarnis]